MEMEVSKILLSSLRASVSVLGVVGMYSIVLGWTVMKRFYFASYLATVAFCVDDPQDQIY